MKHNDIILINTLFDENFIRHKIKRELQDLTNRLISSEHIHTLHTHGSPGMGHDLVVEGQEGDR